jgi:hypothetical protein
MGRFGLRQGLVQAGRRPTESVIGLVEGQLVAYTALALTARHDAPSPCGDLPPPAAALLPLELVLGHSSVLGRHGTADIDALQCVSIGW